MRSKNTAEAGVGVGVGGVPTLRPRRRRSGWSDRCCCGSAPGGAAGGVLRGQGREKTAREATMSAARTDGGGRGGDATTAGVMT